MPKKQFAALILAAGFSTRMKKGHKALLPLPHAGTQCTALETVIRLYQGVGVQDILVVVGQRQQQDLLRVAHSLGAACLTNPEAHRGMFSSVQCALTGLGSGWSHCFVHPVDIPLVRPCTLQLLQASAHSYPETVLIPVFQESEGHPPLLPASSAAAILSWPGEEGLRGALRSLSCVHVHVPDRTILLDMDTDADYAHVCSQALRRDFFTPAEAEALLRYRSVGTRGMAHARAVGAIAREFAIACNRTAYTLNVDAATAGGLLHDMCKGEPCHEQAAGRELRALGLPFMAMLVEDHKDMALAATSPFTEKELVYLADKYVHGDRLVALQERFGAKLTLFAHDTAACQAIQERYVRAQHMEQRLHHELGIAPFSLAEHALQFPQDWS